MTLWDWAFIFTSATMGTVVAYLRHPEHKTWPLMLPLPFTVATLAVGRPVDSTNVVALLVMLAYVFAVWGLRTVARWPIVLAIVVAAGGYCLVGAALAPVTPTGDAAFWCVTMVVWLVGVVLIRWLPYRTEPHYRTPLPVWVKFPVIALVIFGVVQLKQQLGGFMTMFPVMGIVAAYESRHSLWTNVRKVPWVLVTMVPMVASIRVLQTRLGLPVALLMSWLVLLVGFGVMIKCSKRTGEEKGNAETV